MATEQPMPQSTNVEAVRNALTALGEAYRGDWSDFDGRTLRAQLNELVRFLAPGAEPFSYPQWAARSSICPERLCWAQNCPESINYEECSHLTPIFEAMDAGEAR